MKINDLIEEINLNKSKIAFHIASVFADFTCEKDKEWEFFGDFCKELKKSNVYIIKDLKYETMYNKEIKNSYKKLEKILNYDVSSYACNMFTSVMDPFRNYKRENYSDLSDEMVNKIYDLYIKDLPYYWNIGLWCDKFFDFVTTHSEKEYEEMIALVKKNNEKILNYSKDNSFAYSKEKFLGKININRFSRFVKEYKLKDVNDLMCLLTEVNSFTIDISGLADKEIEQVEVNKDKYRKRIGKDSNYVLPVKKANKLKNKIEKIFNDNLFNSAFIESNLGDFFDYYGFEFSKKNINSVIDLYLRVSMNDGVNFYHDFGRGTENFSLYNERVFSQEEIYRWDVIIHEFIHCLERTYSYSFDSEGFTMVNKLVNEVLTEYIARESTKRFFDKEEYSTLEEDKRYDNVIELMDVVAKSSVFKYFVKAKLYDDNVGLLKTIGKKSMDKVNEYFYDIWNNSNISEYYLSCVKKGLKEEIKIIEKRIEKHNLKKSKI